MRKFVGGKTLRELRVGDEVTFFEEATSLTSEDEDEDGDEDEDEDDESDDNGESDGKPPMRIVICTISSVSAPLS